MLIDVDDLLFNAENPCDFPLFLTGEVVFDDLLLPVGEGVVYMPLQATAKFIGKDIRLEPVLIAMIWGLLVGERFEKELIDQDLSEFGFLTTSHSVQYT